MAAVVPCSRLFAGPQPSAVACRRQASNPTLRRATPVRAFKAEAKAEQGGDPAAPPPPPADQEVPKALSSYDDAGYEAGAMPEMQAGAMSSEDEAADTQAYGGATSCPLPPKPPTAEEIAAQLARKEEVLESVDGMVGNYELSCAIGEKQQQLTDAADELQRIMDELKALESQAAAGKGRSEAGEGASVQDLE